MTSTNFVRSYVLAGIAILGFATQANASTYVEIFSEAQVGGTINNPFLNTTAVANGIAYAVSSGDGGNDVGTVVSYDGTTFTTLSDTAQWLATGSTNDIFASEGAAVVGSGPSSVLRFIHSIDNSLYEVALGTGIVTEVIPTLDFSVAAGGAVNLAAQHEVLADGSAYVLDNATDQILYVSPTNTVSVEINTADLAAAAGGSNASIRGIGVQGDNILIGSNTSDSLIAWNTVTNTSSIVLDTDTIDDLTDDIDDVVAFGDIFAAPNGLVYFYEADADYLFSYNPADPAGTLSVVLTEAEFAAGPGSDTINQLAWWDGNIAWTDGSLGFYAIPEPTSALLALAGVACLAAGRRR